ncbi:MAG: rhomboid family intramembrane serine protease [Chloroflexi bacterium]|nr:rhomboid family intramembrane serine protease [Chloroflexota bacterium]MDA1002782.1 rhomboid family intramembrane serine protease [Chloroflexota bacterium]
MFPLRDFAPTRVVPLVTILLIGINVLAFFGWHPLADPAAQAPFLYERAAIACEITTGRPLTLAEISSGRCVEEAPGQAVFPQKQVLLAVIVSLFLHGNLLHLAGNMWFLWIFGNSVEEAFGAVGFVLLYFVGGVLATLGFVWLHPASTDPLIGASGAVAAVLGAYFVLFPRSWVVSLIVFFVTPVPAAIFLGLWFIGQFAVADASVAWEALVAGFALGMVVALLLRRPLKSRVRRIHSGTRAQA